MEIQTYSIEQTLEALLDEKKLSALKDVLTTLNPHDIAKIFEAITKEKLPMLFRLLPKELAAETFVEMDEDSQEYLIHAFSDRELKEVIDELYVDDAVDIIEEMPANVVKRILRQADPEIRKSINEILQYPEDSAGSIMTVEYVSLRPKMTVEESIKRIRRTGVDKETIYTCYVTNTQNMLVGMVTAKTLLLANEDDLIADIMETNIISVNTMDDQEFVAHTFSKYDFLALPVVDRESRLVGIVTFDDAMDVMEDEATEDIEKMAAITPSDKPYLRTSVMELFKARIPWLLLLMISATFTGLIINSFENALASQIVLSTFIPMIMDTGGNSGSQASVTVIRGLSIGEIELKNVFKIMWKEIRVAILCGLTLAVASFIKIMIVDKVSILVAVVVSITLFFTVLMAKIIGCTLPLAAKKIGFDPAVMASPFITTIVDALALMVYFQFASTILGL